MSRAAKRETRAGWGQLLFDLMLAPQNTALSG